MTREGEDITLAGAKYTLKESQTCTETIQQYSKHPNKVYNIKEHLLHHNFPFSLHSLVEVKSKTDPKSNTKLAGLALLVEPHNRERRLRFGRPSARPRRTHHPGGPAPLRWPPSGSRRSRRRGRRRVRIPRLGRPAAGPGRRHHRRRGTLRFRLGRPSAAPARRRRQCVPSVIGHHQLPALFHLVKVVG